MLKFLKNRNSKIHILMLLFVAIVNTDPAVKGADQELWYFMVGTLINFSFFFILVFIISLLFKSVVSKQKVFRNISVFLFLLYILYTFIKY